MTVFEINGVGKGTLVFKNPVLGWCLVEGGSLVQLEDVDQAGQEMIIGKLPQFIQSTVRTDLRNMLKEQISSGSLN
jgi:hypothetical protein